ncbi:MAG: cytochrome c oxidase accessory protein CcoG [Hyphomicrobiales bacterium]|nr:cytochrome c oxidase accessory protein CcoG [Hyphomicrobiales bacterium]
MTQPSAPVPYTDDDDIPLFAPTPKVYPQKVSGTYRRIKWGLLIVGMAIYYLLPFVRWDRGPNLPDQAVLVDFERRRFYFFFIELWPQEVYYFTGLLILAAIILFLMNALAGRVWCGYLCPQTVWTDLFLRVERFFEGDRRDRIKLDDAPWTADKVARKAGKHFVWLMIAWWTGGAWVLYFADAPTLVRDLATFQAPFTAYVWIGILTTTTYILAGHLREQVCLHMCPWPRIQAALTDEHALNVSYRYDRGEPRMSVKDAKRAREAEQPAGDCIDCHQCVAVCPTGVDIRQGSQLGCIQCGLCIDACDTVMTKIGRPTRLIAYDTDEAIMAREVGQTPTYKPIRARTMLYAAVIALVGGAMVYQLATRAFLGMNLIHDRTPLFVTLRDGSIRNTYTVRLINKRTESRQIALTIDGPTSVAMDVQGATPTSDWRPIVSVDPDTTREIRVLVTIPRSSLQSGTNMIRIKASDLFAGETVTIAENFFAP